MGDVDQIIDPSSRFRFSPRFGQGRNRHVANVFAVAGIGSWKIERLRLAEIARRHSAGEIRRLRT
jgi:16S rRNA U516 pseudouridylate synthase RsuA-like enzyme